MRETHFKTLKDATDRMIVMDFEGVLEYKITFKPKTVNEDEYWIVSRKILHANAFEKPRWVKL